MASTEPTNNTLDMIENNNIGTSPIILSPDNVCDDKYEEKKDIIISVAALSSAATSIIAPSESVEAPTFLPSAAQQKQPTISPEQRATKKSKNNNNNKYNKNNKYKQKKKQNKYKKDRKKKNKKFTEISKATRNNNNNNYDSNRHKDEPPGPTTFRLPGGTELCVDGNSNLGKYAKWKLNNPNGTVEDYRKNQWTQFLPK